MRCDVCLLLEGTYPYVSGGVSTWVAQILEKMPDITFGIIYIGASSREVRKLKYQIPPNVTEIREVFIHDVPEFTHHPGRKSRLSSADWEIIRTFQRQLVQGEPVNLSALHSVACRLPDLRDFHQELSSTREAWETALGIYRDLIPPGASFIDFYWTHRFVNTPLLQLLRTPPIRARVYHTACTGYAGALGALLSQITGAPLLISEHGIYTRERRIEIFDAEWICGDPTVPLSLDLARQSNFFKEWWVNFFLSLSRTAYRNSSRIYSLFSANRRDQIADGAPPERVRIIPNGIEINAFASLPGLRQRPPKKDDEPYVVGYVGRVVPIKDVKTLIRSLPHLMEAGVRVKALIMGPEDEDEKYAAECHELVEALGIENEVVFTGPVKVREWLPKLDVMVISSISEGLPFAILEAGCAGVPVVSTDVGSCRELVFGQSQEDREIGPGGIIVPIASPTEMGAALARLALNSGLAMQMADAARARMRRFYDLNKIMNTYREEYEYWMEVGFSGMSRYDSAGR